MTPCQDIKTNIILFTVSSGQFHRIKICICKLKTDHRSLHIPTHFLVRSVEAKKCYFSLLTLWVLKHWLTTIY